MKYYLKLALTYILPVIWLIAIFFINHFAYFNPVIVTIVFFGLLLVPGFSLGRIFQIKTEKDNLGQFVIWLATGLIFALIICFAGMLLGLTIYVLTSVYLFLVTLVLIIALGLDIWKKRESPTCNFAWQDWIRPENLVYILILAILATVCVSVINVGSLLKGGDPNFHTAILEKAFAGQPLNPTNLGFIKSDTIHIAYGLPIWHVFMAVLTVLFHTSPLVLWTVMTLPLSILSFIIWAWLFQIVFRRRFFVFLGLAMLAIYIFNWNTGYLFTCLPIPDTFSSMILFPLVVSLTLAYIFGETASWKLLILSCLMAVLMAAIHLTQYVYYLMEVFVFGLLWLATQWKTKEYREIIKRIGWVLLFSFAIFIPFLVLLELKSHIISKVLTENLVDTTSSQTLRFGTYAGYDIYSKYAYLLTPLILIFIRNNKRLLFVFGLMIIAPLVYLKPVSAVMLKVLGYIFVNRLFGTITWHYLVLALFLGFIILIIDRLWAMIKLPKLFGWIRYVIDAVVLYFVIRFAQIQFSLINVPVKKEPGKTVLAPLAKVYNLLFSDASGTWFTHNLGWILTGVIVVTIGVLILQYFKPKTVPYFDFEEPKDGFLSGILVAFILIIFFSPTWQFIQENWKNVSVKNSLIGSQIKPAIDFQTQTTKAIGGQAMVTYVEKNIPPKSVFIAPGSVIYTFPVILDQFMVAYPRTGKLTRYSRIYDKKYTLDEQLIQIAKSQMEYVLLYAPEKQNREFFDQYPEYFKKVFDNNSMIYQVSPQARIDGQKLIDQPVK